MKKKVILAMCIAAALALAGCGNKNETAKTDDGQEEAEATVSYEPVLYEDLSSKLISLGQYKGLEVSRDTAEVTDEDVAKEVWDNEKQYLELKDVDRPAEEGDVLTIDFTGYVDGESSDNLKGTDTQLELGSGTFIPGFEDQLIGVNAEDDVEVNVVFPDEYYEEVAGKEARFEVHVSKVQAYDTSVWNDEYVKQNTDYKSQEDMENSIRNDLESTAQSDATSNWEF